MKEKSLIKNIIKIWVFLGIILGIILIFSCRFIVGYSDDKVTNLFLIISDIGSCLGLFYVILNNVKLKIALYAGIITDITMIIVSSQQKIYLSTLFYALYAIPSLVLGIFNWNKNKINTVKTKLSKKSYLILFITFLFAYGLAVGFSYLANSNLIFLDSLSICLSGVALFFLSRRSFLQWPIFIMADVFCITEYTFLFLKNSGVLSVLIMICFYFLNDVLGFFNWYEDIKISRKKDIFCIITKNK